MSVLSLYAALWLAWDPSTDATRYRIHWAREGVEPQSADVGIETKTSIANLTFGQRYFVWVTAVNKDGESDPSNVLFGRFTGIDIERASELPSWSVYRAQTDLVPGEQMFYRLQIK